MEAEDVTALMDENAELYARWRRNWWPIVALLVAMSAAMLALIFELVRPVPAFSAWTGLALVWGWMSWQQSKIQGQIKANVRIIQGWWVRERWGQR
jgi:hypothetical protein